MVRARAAALVLLDASPFYRFCEAQLLPSLAEYLRGNARVTSEVTTELRRGARSGGHAGLRYLELAGWPPETAALPAELQRPFLDYSRAARQKDEPPSKHAGEIATVLMAAHLGAAAVVIDDLFGKRLARDRGVPRLSTAQLAAEMVAEGQLTDDDGYRAFDLSTPSEAGRADFIRACDRARTARG
jgi:hypothetical protein